MRVIVEDNSDKTVQILLRQTKDGVQLVARDNAGLLWTLGLLMADQKGQLFFQRAYSINSTDIATTEVHSLFVL